MVRSMLMARPARSLLLVLFVAVCWLLLSSAEARAEEPAPRSPGLLGQVARTLGDDVVAPVARTTTDTTVVLARTVDRTLERGSETVTGTTKAVTKATGAVAPVAPVVRTTTGTVDRVVETTTSVTREAVRSTADATTRTVTDSTKVLSDNVIGVSDVVDGALADVGAAVDAVVGSVDRAVVPVPEVPLTPIVPSPSDGSTTVVAPGSGADTGEREALDTAVARLTAPVSASASTRSPVLPVAVTSVAAAVGGSLAGAVLPGRPDALTPVGALSALVCLAAAGGALTGSGSGPLSAAAALAPRHSHPPLGTPPAATAALRGPVPGPALLPGSSPG